MSYPQIIIHVFFVLIFLLVVQQSISTLNARPKEILPPKFMLGYLTGSQRKPNDFKYSRPGQVISGAISYAVDMINRHSPLVKNKSIDFIIAETYGEESESIKQTARLWPQVSAYIGPQETCVHEARIAESFNLPMISYVSKRSPFLLIITVRFLTPMTCLLKLNN